MKPSVLISIQPQNVANICEVIDLKNGKSIYRKTIEVRKDRPKKVETPFKCLIYETKAKYKKGIGAYFYGIELRGTAQGCGKVIGEFVCDRIEEIDMRTVGKEERCRIQRESCLTREQLTQYLELVTLYKKKGYGWHISDLKIYDKPKELGEFYTTSFGKNDSCCTCANYPTKENGIDYFEAQCRNCKNAHELFKKKLTTPPQSWCYVENL